MVFTILRGVYQTRMIGTFLNVNAYMVRMVHTMEETSLESNNFVGEIYIK